MAKKAAEIWQELNQSALTTEQKAGVLVRLLKRALNAEAAETNLAPTSDPTTLSLSQIAEILGSKAKKEEIIESIVKQIKGDKLSELSKINLLSALLRFETVKEDTETPYCRGGGKRFLILYIDSLLSEINFQKLSEAIEQWISKNYNSYKNSASSHISDFINLTFNHFSEKSDDMAFLFKIINAMYKDLSRRGLTEVESKILLGRCIQIKLYSYLTTPILDRLQNSRNNELNSGVIKDLNKLVANRKTTKELHGKSFKEYTKNSLEEKTSHYDTYYSDIRTLVYETINEIGDYADELNALAILESATIFTPMQKFQEKLFKMLTERKTTGFSEKTPQDQTTVINSWIAHAMAFKEKFNSYLNLKAENFIDHALDSLENAVLNKLTATTETKAHGRQRSTSSNAILSKVKETSKAIETATKEFMHGRRRSNTSHAIIQTTEIKVNIIRKSNRRSMQLPLSAATQALKDGKNLFAQTSTNKLNDDDKELRHVSSEGSVPKFTGLREVPRVNPPKSNNRIAQNKLAGKFNSVDVSSLSPSTNRFFGDKDAKTRNAANPIQRDSSGLGSSPPKRSMSHDRKHNDSIAVSSNTRRISPPHSAALGTSPLSSVKEEETSSVANRKESPVPISERNNSPTKRISPPLPISSSLFKPSVDVEKADNVSSAPSEVTEKSNSVSKLKAKFEAEGMIGVKQTLSNTPH